MTAYADLMEMAETEYPSYKVEYPDSVTVTLRAILDLNDEEMAKFQEIQNKLGELDETANMAELRSEFVEILVLVSENEDIARAKLADAPLKFLVVLFKEYTKNLEDAAKSAGTAPTTS